MTTTPPATPLRPGEYWAQRADGTWYVARVYGWYMRLWKGTTK